MNNLRILEILKMIPEHHNVLDVGTDHAYLPILLKQQNKERTVVASDIHDNALKMARASLEKAEMVEDVQLILSDGLDNVDVDNLDTLVIAGMGTFTILSILENSKALLFDIIIIQSNNNHEILRKAMNEKGFLLEEERVICEANHYYPIMKYRKGKEVLTETEILFGKYVLRNEAYYNYLYQKKFDLLKKIPSEKKEEIELIKKDLLLIESYLKGRKLDYS